MERFDVEAVWKRYIAYLFAWADDHKDGVFAGMSPVCWDEWLDEFEEEYEVY